MAKFFDYKFDDNVAVYPLGDMHIGSPQCDMGLVQRAIDKVLSNKNYFCVLLGDQLDMALAGSKSDVYTATCTPGKAIIDVANKFRPLVEAGKVLAILDGNHEDRLRRMAGVSPSEMIAEILQRRDLYCPTTAVLKLTVRDRTSTVYCSHGNGGGARIGGKANALEKLSWVCDADVIMAGHTHTPMVFRNCKIDINTENGLETVRSRLFVNCASCLTYLDSYGENKGYVPSSNVYPIVHFFKDHDPAVIL